MKIIFVPTYVVTLSTVQPIDTANFLTLTQDKSLYRCMGSFTCHNKFSHYKIGEEGYNNEASMLHHTTISDPQQY